MCRSPCRPWPIRWMPYARCWATERPPGRPLLAGERLRGGRQDGADAGQGQDDDRPLLALREGMIRRSTGEHRRPPCSFYSPHRSGEHPQRVSGELAGPAASRRRWRLWQPYDIAPAASAALLRQRDKPPQAARRDQQGSTSTPSHQGRHAPHRGTHRRLTPLANCQETSHRPCPEANFVTCGCHQCWNHPLF